MRTRMRGAWRHTIAASVLFLTLAGGSRAATITIVNVDGPGEGFNDPTPVAPVGGNPGTTIGAQRLYVFNHAAGIWGGILPSSVEIKVNAQFSPQTCDASGAVLGGASAGSSHRNFPNAPFTNTWYQQSLANRLAGFDLNPGVNDINITFNSNIGDTPTPTCPFCWYYGVDGNEGTCVELLPVVLHELGHGLGFATITLAGVQMGTPPGPHVYDRFLYDLDQDMHWHEMAGDAQRGASAVNCQRLVWDGLCVSSAAPGRLGPKPVLRVNSPGAIAGDYEVGLATFGPQTFNVSGNLVLANDGSLPPNSPTNACEPLTNGAQIAGNIALVDRGTCPFVVKVKNAQDAGAIGVVVADSMPGCPPLGMSGVDPTITIPVVRITTDDGAAIKSQLLGGVNVTMLFDATLDAGTAEGKILVYTPTVFATGSSVSHWDISPQPNLLMEPFATASLHDDPDLTVEQYEDIGWFGTPGPCGATATVLTFFNAEGRDDGILLRWQLADPQDAVAVTVDRADGVDYAWSPIEVTFGREGEIVTALDTSAEPGREYLYRLNVVDQSGSSQVMGLASGRRLGTLESGVFLRAPFPNPTPRGATLVFRITRAEYVRLSIVDVTGRAIRTLHEGMLPPGEHLRLWDGLTTSRVEAAPGIYLVSLRTSEGVRTQRISVSR
jgi:PA domain-containing protein